MYWPEYPYAPVTATRMDGFAPFTGLQAADEEAGGLIDQAEREPPAEPSAHLYIVSVMMGECDDGPGSKRREWWRCQTFVVGFGQIYVAKQNVLRFTIPFSWAAREFRSGRT